MEQDGPFFSHDYRPAGGPVPPPPPISPTPPVPSADWARRSAVLYRLGRTRQLCRKRQNEFRRRAAAAAGRSKAARDREKAHREFLARTCYLCGDTTGGERIVEGRLRTVRDVCDDCMAEMTGRVTPFQASCRHARRGNPTVIDPTESGNSFDDVVRAQEDVSLSP